MTVTGPVVSRFDLGRHGLVNTRTQYWNLCAAELVEHAVRRGEGRLAADGPLVVETGEHTGRSPKDKFIVEDAETRDSVWWGEVNAPITRDGFDRLRAKVFAYLQDREVYVQDLHAGADPDYRLPVRVICERAWHAHFARNMFLRPAVDRLGEFEPGFTVIHAPGLLADPERDGVNSTTFICVDFAQRTVLIGGSEYAGEIKKSIFTVLNYLLPADGVLPMHCSANMGDGGDVALFFGLSGTGKTTLSADAARALIGDDEHGWSNAGVFNFEGGCYAKVIRLSAEAEPEIYATTKRFGTVLENVVMDPATRAPDLDDGRRELEDQERIVFRYCDAKGQVTPEANPNGSVANIAGITNRAGNVLGLMPHPENLVEPALGGTDGRAMFEGLAEALS